jgi:hypothetical protein
MTALRNTWVTVADLGTNGNGPDQFTLSNIVDANAKRVSSDTSALPAYAGGGTGARQTPRLNGALLAAADDHASNDVVRQRRALEWVYNDLQNGIRHNASDIAVPPAYSTISNFNELFTRWRDATAAFNKPTVMYEGAYDALFMAQNDGPKLGIDPVGCAGTNCYAGPEGKINSLITAFKNSDYGYLALIQMANMASTVIPDGEPAYSADISQGANVGNIWALVYGNLRTAFTSPYKFLDAFKEFNSGISR